MQNYQDISEDSCFSDAFRSHNQEAMAQLVSVGELICLPVVVLVSFLAQPRIQYAMAKDGLFPKVFMELDKNGNLTKGMWISGIVTTLIAIFVPFSYLDDVISAGVLFSFNLSNSSIIVIRRGQVTHGENGWHLCSKLLVAFHVVAIAFAFCAAQLITYSLYEDVGLIIGSVLLLVALILLAITISLKCPENEDPEAHKQYRISMMPFPPLCGIVLNYILIGQLTGLGLVLTLCYFFTALIYYFTYCIGRDDADEIKEHLLGHDQESSTQNSPFKYKEVNILADEE